MDDVKQSLRSLDGLEPPDLWDEARRRTPRPSIGSTPPRSHRFAVIAAALAIAVAATSLAVIALRPGDERASTGDLSTWATGGVRSLELAYRFPPTWRVQPFDQPVGHVQFEGALVSNVDQEIVHLQPADGGVTSAWDLHALPADGVVVSIEHIIGPFDPEIVGPDTPLPLNLDDAKTGGSGHAPAGTTSLWLPFQFHDAGLGVRVWIGADASDEDRAAAREIVASIGPISATPSGSPDRLMAGAMSCESSEAIDLDREPNYSARYLSRWTTWDGCDVRLDVVMTRSGGCFEGVDEIVMGWPIGSSSRNADRLFVRDPLGELSETSAREFDPSATLPGDAVDTGLSQGGHELWIRPTDDADVWIVHRDIVEQWPREHPVVACL